MHDVQPTVRAVFAEDLLRVNHILARFDALHLNRALWATLFPPPWQRHADRRAIVGYALCKGGDEAVGFIGVLQSEQVLEGRTRTVINLHSWYVMKEYRRYSMNLLFAALGHKDAVYIDLTPTADACFLLQKLGFRILERSVVTYFNRVSIGTLMRQRPLCIKVAVASEHVQANVISDHTGTHARWVSIMLPSKRSVIVAFTWIEQALSLSDLPYALAVALESEAEAASIVAVPAIYILYTSDAEGFGQSLPWFASWCQRHYGTKTVIADTRLTSPYHQKQAVTMPLVTPRLVRGEGIAPQSVSNLYSELALFNTVPQGALDYGTHGKIHAIRQTILANSRLIETQARRVDELDARIREAESRLNGIVR